MASDAVTVRAFPFSPTGCPNSSFFSPSHRKLLDGRVRSLPIPFSRYSPTLAFSGRAAQINLAFFLHRGTKEMAALLFPPMLIVFPFLSSSPRRSFLSLFRESAPPFFLFCRDLRTRSLFFFGEPWPWVAFFLVVFNLSFSLSLRTGRSLVFPFYGSCKRTFLFFGRGEPGLFFSQGVASAPSRYPFRFLRHSSSPGLGQPFFLKIIQLLTFF